MKPAATLLRYGALLSLPLWPSTAASAFQGSPDARPRPGPAAALDTTLDLEAPEGTRGVFTFSFDNDVLLLKDTNYTAGLGFEWVTGELAGLGRSNVFRQFKDTFEWLPGMDDVELRHYASAALNYEMYTPRDLDVTPAPPDQQPYAGIAALDLGLFARDADSLRAYGLRLGLVGPATGAEGLQKSLHKILGAVEPLGWDDQLSNEPLINAFYRYQERLADSSSGAGFGFDSFWAVGGGLGNYFTGAAASASLRFGYSVPDHHSINLIPTTRQVMVGVERPNHQGFSAFVHLSTQAMATAVFLPTDGNTFEDSASIDRDPLSADVSAGLYLMYRRFILGIEVHNANDMFENDINRNRQYGSLRFSWIY